MFICDHILENSLKTILIKCIQSLAILPFFTLSQWNRPVPQLTGLTYICLCYTCVSAEVGFTVTSSIKPFSSIAFDINKSTSFLLILQQIFSLQVHTVQ